MNHLLTGNEKAKIKQSSKYYGLRDQQVNETEDSMSDCSSDAGGLTYTETKIVPLNTFGSDISISNPTITIIDDSHNLDNTLSKKNTQVPTPVNESHHMSHPRYDEIKDIITFRDITPDMSL